GVAQATLPARHVSLKGYLARVTVEIGTYRGLLRQLDALAPEEGQVNIDPVVERYYGVADRIEDLDAEWQALDSPVGLRVRHLGMGRVFVLFAEAYRIHA